MACVGVASWVDGAAGTGLTPVGGEGQPNSGWVMGSGYCLVSSSAVQALETRRVYAAQGSALASRFGQRRNRPRASECQRWESRTEDAESIEWAAVPAGTREPLRDLFGGRKLQGKRPISYFTGGVDRANRNNYDRSK